MPQAALSVPPTGLRGQPQLVAVLAMPAGFPGGLPWSGLFHGCREDGLLLGVLAQKLGKADSAGNLEPLWLSGQPQRQLRDLLRRQGIAGYDDRRLNAFELLERLAAGDHF